MEREVRISLEVEEPAALPWIGLAADVDPAIDVVEHDLEASRLAGPPPGRGDVDRSTLLERSLDLFLGGSHPCKFLSASRDLYSAAELRSQVTAATDFCGSLPIALRLIP